TPSAAISRQRRRQLRQRARRDDQRLYKAEVIHRRGPWRTLQAVEYATLEWVDWFNNRRLLEPIGNVPPAEAEAAYYRSWRSPRQSSHESNEPASEEAGTVHSFLVGLRQDRDRKPE